MFEKLGHVAEQMATSLSRRECLGRLGRGALAVTAAIGGLLALPGSGGAHPGVHYCGPGSNPLCVGQPEGFGCGEGRCRRSPGSSDCACWTPRPPRS